MSLKTYDLPPHLVRRAMREAEEAIRAQHRAGIFDEGDPNHPKHNGGINYATGMPVSLFGCDPGAFLARQYKG